MEVRSGHLRWLGIMVSGLVILFSGYYSYRYGQKHFISFKDCLEQSEAMDGRSFVLNYRKVLKVGPGYFEIKEGDLTVEVRGDIPGLKAGDIITVKGIFKKEGYLSLKSFYLSRYRNLKYIVSCLGVILPFVLFLINFRFDCRRLVWLERN